MTKNAIQPRFLEAVITALRARGRQVATGHAVGYSPAQAAQWVCGEAVTVAVEPELAT